VSRCSGRCLLHQAKLDLFLSRPDHIGESIIKTQPVASALSSSRLSSRCTRCWLDERELSIAQGKMHEYESRVGAVQLSGKQKEEEEKGLKRCTGCKVVRYCSTVSSIPLSIPSTSNWDWWSRTLIPCSMHCPGLSNRRLAVTLTRMPSPQTTPPSDPQKQTTHQNPISDPRSG
jgi:hypothetical protein